MRILWNKINSITFGIKGLIGAGWLLPVISILFLVNVYGCQSYQKCPPRRDFDYYRCTTSNSPKLIFDIPIYSQKDGFRVSSEQIGRNDWPNYSSAYGFTSTGEIIRYEERRYDDQYITSNNMPRQHFHRRIYGRRGGLMYR